MAFVDFRSQYSASDKTRAKDHKDTLCWEFPMHEYVHDELFPVFCRTDGFSTADDVEASAILMKKSGGDVMTVTVNRNDGRLWPFMPSTLFTARDQNKVGVLWVKKKFLTDHGLKDDQLGEVIADGSTNRPKWPASAGTFLAKKLLFLRLARELLGPGFARTADVLLALTGKNEP